MKTTENCRSGHKCQQGYLKELSIHIMLLVLLMITSFFDFTENKSSVMITVGAAFRVVAIFMLSYHMLNRFLFKKKNLISGMKSSRLFSCSVVLIVCSFSLSFVGRTLFTGCEGSDNDQDSPCHSHADRIPSYFYLNAAVLCYLQMTCGFQSLRSLTLCWAFIAGSLAMYQLRYGVLKTVVDDVIVAMFIFISLSTIKRTRVSPESDAGLAPENQLKDMQHLIGNISHDLKTPVHALAMELSLLRDQLSLPVNSWRESQRKEKVDMKKHLESVTMLQDTCAFMLMIINRNLDSAATSAGVSLVPKNSTVCLPEVLSSGVDCIYRSQQRLDGNGGGATIVLLPLSINICTHIVTDRQWLVDNLMCLISNAVKFGKESNGSVTVSCQLTSEEAEGRWAHHDPQEEYLLFEVEDNGIGISAKAAETLFQPSLQPGHGGPSATGGTGLGLYSLSQRVTALGGRCGARNCGDGRSGSVVWFSLPYTSDQFSANFVEVSSRNSAGTRRIRTYSDCGSNVTMSQNVKIPLRILVADDSLVVQKSTRRFIASVGHTVDVASNGLIALDMLLDTGADYDLVLMDIQMPVMGGIEAVQRLRLHEMESGVPSQDRQKVVGISANSEAEIERDALASGMDTFMPKPFSVGDMALICAKLDIKF